MPKQKDIPEGHVAKYVVLPSDLAATIGRYRHAAEHKTEREAFIAVLQAGLAELLRTSRRKRPTLQEAAE